MTREIVLREPRKDRVAIWNHQRNRVGRLIVIKHHLIQVCRVRNNHLFDSLRTVFLAVVADEETLLSP